MNPEICPRYSTTNAAEAVGLQADRVQAWLDRGAFELAAIDTDTTGTGIRREWTLRTVRKLSLMAALVRMGISLAKASAAAETCIKKTEFISEYARNLAVIESSGTVKVLSIDNKAPFEEILDNHIGGGDSLLFIDLNRLFARVTDRLKAVHNFTDED